jgi:hypothetical protein
MASELIFGQQPSGLIIALPDDSRRILRLYDSSRVVVLKFHEVAVRVADRCETPHVTATEAAAERNEELASCSTLCPKTAMTPLGCLKVVW